jgi:hypothetical protein
MTVANQIGKERTIAVLDGRTRAAKRRRALIADLMSDLGRLPSATEWELVRQAADLILSRETMTAAAVRGEPVSHDAIVKISNSATRTIACLRNKGGKRDAAPPLTMRERILRDRRAT